MTIHGAVLAVVDVSSYVELFLFHHQLDTNLLNVTHVTQIIPLFVTVQGFMLAAVGDVEFPSYHAVKDFFIPTS